MQDSGPAAHLAGGLRAGAAGRRQGRRCCLCGVVGRGRGVAVVAVGPHDQCPAPCPRHAGAAVHSRLTFASPEPIACATDCAWAEACGAAAARTCRAEGGGWLVVAWRRARAHGQHGRRMCRCATPCVTCSGSPIHAMFPTCCWYGYPARAWLPRGRERHAIMPPRPLAPGRPWQWPPPPTAQQPAATACGRSHRPLWLRNSVMRAITAVEVLGEGRCTSKGPRSATLLTAEGQAQEQSDSEGTHFVG